jgi:hypothetical protein
MGQGLATATGYSLSLAQLQQQFSLYIESILYYSSVQYTIRNQGQSTNKAHKPEYGATVTCDMTCHAHATWGGSAHGGTLT